MKFSTNTGAPCLALLALAFAAGCERGPAARVDGIVQTKYPGQVSAGGETSGTILARTARPTTNAIYAGGTPGIAGGSGGNTAGANVGGATRETGQGPDQGVSAPSGVQPGTRAPDGDYGRPAAPGPGAQEAPAATNIAPNPPAPMKELGKP